MPVKAGRISGELLLVALLAGMGVYVLVDTSSILVPAGAVHSSPRMFPYVIGSLLVLVAVLLAAQVLRGQAAPAEEGEDVDVHRGTDWRAVVLLAVLFAGHALLIVPIGWPLAAALLFGGVAMVLGSRKWWVVALSALLLPIVLWLVFWFGLGVYLPPGPLLQWVL